MRTAALMLLLPGSPSGWGLARDKDGRWFVSLQDGRVLCFSE